MGVVPTTIAATTELPAMSIVTQAITFLTSLILRPSRPVCPHCGSSLWKKHGCYRRGQRCLDVLRLATPIQRYKCLNRRCAKTWADRPPWLVPNRWYGRDVIRKALDLCCDGTTSWRELAELLHAEITGGGRALRWAPWRRPRQGAGRVRLAHTTVWRWFGEAASRAQAPQSLAGRYGGMFSGVLATDESWGWVKATVDGVGQKVGFGIQALVDGATRVVLSLRRLADESEEALRAGVEDLPQLGVELSELKVWLSDGLRTYEALLAMLGLGRLPRQRSLFHLWRNLLGMLKTYAPEQGEAAGRELQAAVRAVWDAPSERQAVKALYDLVERYGAQRLAQGVVGFVRATFREATYHLRGEVAGLGRTTGVVEWVWRRFKRRMRLMQVFMAQAMPQQYLGLYELYLNFHRYQVRRERRRRYPYAGLCPLEIAGQRLEVEVEGRRVVATWLDALGI